MMIPSTDTRSVQQKALDEKIAMEAPLPPPKLPPDAKARPLEDFSPKAKKPVAIVGIVENGLIRVLDPEVKLTERSRVIIVAQEPA